MCIEFLVLGKSKSRSKYEDAFENELIELYYKTNRCKIFVFQK